jgi:hypothetical protein
MTIQINLKAGTRLAKLTEKTIQTRTKSGDIPLHRAAKNGRFWEIPRYLLRPELFLIKSND